MLVTDINKRKKDVAEALIQVGLKNIANSLQKSKIYGSSEDITRFINTYAQKNRICLRTDQWDKILKVLNKN